MGSILWELGKRPCGVDATSLDNQMEKNMENEMETRVI